MVLTMNKTEKKPKKTITLNLNELFEKVIYMYDMARIKEPLIIPPDIEFNPDSSFKIGLFNFIDRNVFCRYIEHISKTEEHHAVTKYGGKIELYPERIRQYVMSLTWSHCPVEFMYAFIVHTMLYAHIHHVYAVKQYLKHRKEMRVHGPKEMERYFDCLQYFKRKQTHYDSFDRDYCESLAMYYFSRSITRLFESDFGEDCEFDYKKGLKLAVAYQDRYNADHNVYLFTRDKRLRRGAPRTYIDNIINDIIEHGKEENVKINLIYGEMETIVSEDWP